MCAYGDNACKLELPAMLAKLHPVFNVALLKHYIGDVVLSLDPIKLDNGPEYEVDAILNHWWVSQRCTYLKYLVSFVGYDTSHSHNEWLTAANLANALDILCSYQNVHGLA